MIFTSCLDFSNEVNTDDVSEWSREAGPIYRDSIIGEDYESASDPHVFYDNDSLYMIYSGDYNGLSSIKLAKGTAVDDWEFGTTLLGDVGPSGLDEGKETAYYRKDKNGKHQIYYIGYLDNELYESQIFLAEADNLTGPYVQMDAPIVPRGLVAGEELYCMTSPSVVEHEGVLYLSFIGWNNSPSEVTEVWIIGATSSDSGHSWEDFQIVETRIGMEGQVTKVGENNFVSVRTGEFADDDAIFYATASHPFGPWIENDQPILLRAGPPFEKDEIIGPQIFVDSVGNETLFYTGADYQIGWWIMIAQE